MLFVVVRTVENSTVSIKKTRIRRKSGITYRLRYIIVLNWLPVYVDSCSCNWCLLRVSGPAARLCFRYGDRFVLFSKCHDDYSSRGQCQKKKKNRRRREPRQPHLIYFLTLLFTYERYSSVRPSAIHQYTILYNDDFVRAAEESRRTGSEVPKSIFGSSRRTYIIIVSHIASRLPRE